MVCLFEFPEFWSYQISEDFKNLHKESALQLQTNSTIVAVQKTFFSDRTIFCLRIVGSHCWLLLCCCNPKHSLWCTLACTIRARQSSRGCLFLAYRYPTLLILICFYFWGCYSRCHYWKMTFTSDDVNFIIYRYLHESGSFLSGLF